MVHKKRGIVNPATIVLFIPMKFVPIQPGKFWMGEKGKKVKVEIPKSYEMSVFLVTQWQWAIVMGQNPSHFKDGVAEAVAIEINGQMVKMQPDHPVEKADWNAISVFIEKLNQLSQVDDALVYKIISDHQRRKKYRLPTEEEWECAVRAKTNTEYFFGDDESKLKDYSWFEENANDQTHPVGEKLPNPWGLYDVYGNVWEWMKYKRHRGVIPIYVTRGGSYYSSSEYLCSASRIVNYPELQKIGFRLVRVNAR